MNLWKKNRKPRKERIEDIIEDVTNRAQKDRDGKPILSYGGRDLRRGSGTPASRKFAEKMAIPKGKK